MARVHVKGARRMTRVSSSGGIIPLLSPARRQRQRGTMKLKFKSLQGSSFTVETDPSDTVSAGRVELARVCRLAFHHCRLPR